MGAQYNCPNCETTVVVANQTIAHSVICARCNRDMPIRDTVETRYAGHDRGPNSYIIETDSDEQ